jgi:hypothetical protein
MPSPFESVARVAIDEIIRKHVVSSRFGHFLSEDGFQELSNEIFEFLQTSRSLKSAGDRLLKTMGAPQQNPGARQPMRRPGS